MAKQSNFPTAQVERLPTEFVSETVHDLLQLHNLGQPQTDQEVSDRITMYFQFCEQKGFRPGVEGLCLSLHISRTTLFRWSRGDGCSEFRQETIESAKAMINAFLEASALSGHLSPPIAIFALKNWCNYKDTISVEEMTPSGTKTMPTEDLQSIRTRYSKLTDNDADSDL